MTQYANDIADNNECDTLDRMWEKYLEKYLGSRDGRSKWKIKSRTVHAKTTFNNEKDFF